MARLLIVDDDPHLRRLVSTYAQRDGYLYREARDGAEALSALERDSFDLVVLDVMMPGMDGFEVLTEIRKTSQIPVIMLTARDEEYDRLNGFELGIDDYVSKPFSPKELMARIKAVLKRCGNTERTKDEVFRFGELVINSAARSVMADGRRLNLPPKEFELLLALAQNERIVLDREKLLQLVWGYNYMGDIRTVDTHVKSLREHLGPYRRLIRTVWGVGYKFENSESD